MDADFRIDRDDKVAVITFDRPPARNALDRRTRVALVDALQELDDDPTVRAIVITGEDPAFSSGLDAKELLSDGYTPPPVDPATRLRAMNTPTIAAVNGVCVSGALELVLACSFIIASERATFMDTHARLGLTPGWGLSAELPATVGAARARQMTLTGLPVDAATALIWGLANEVVPHPELLSRAGELAAAMASIAPASSVNAMTLYRAGRDDLLVSARIREREVYESWVVAKDDARSRFGDRK